MGTKFEAGVIEQIDELAHSPSNMHNDMKIGMLILSSIAISLKRMADLIEQARDEVDG